MKTPIFGMNRTFAAVLNVIVTRLSVLLALFVLTETGAFAVDEQNANEQNVQKRITVDGACENPLVGADFIARVTSCNLHRVIRADFAMIESLARGEYDVAIEKSQRVLKARSAWWNNPDANDDELTENNPYLVAEYARLLAIAYELKGDYHKTLGAYAAAYGKMNEEYRWAETRLNYSLGGKPEWTLSRLSSLLNESYRLNLEQLISVEAVCKRHENSNGAMKRNDPTWVALWKFRLNCARVVCPELLFVSELDQGSGKRVGRDFYELQKESYEKFIDYAEEYWNENPANGETEEPNASLEFLKALKDLPYPFE